jgi:cell division protein FtsB
VGVLLIVLALAYAYPVREYLAQEAEISAMEQAQAEQRDRIRDLTERVAKWDDDNYVIAQARSRLQLVRRGEVLFVVGPESPVVPAGEQAADEPWISQLWSNLQAADNPGERG